MNNNNFPQERESDQDSSMQETDASHDQGHYENYRRKSLPEGYTPYRETHQVNELVYDQIDQAYSTNERPDSRRKSCKIGWLLNASKFFIISPNGFKSFFKGFSEAESNKYSTRATNLFFADSGSVRAKRFKD